MSAPGWARTCTCGATPFGYYCGECNAWSGAMPSDVAPHNDFNLAKQGGPETSAPEPATPAPSVEPEPQPEPWCECSPCKSARVVGNAAYCNACDGRLRPSASSHYSHGTGH